MENNFNSKKHMIHSAILFNFLTILAPLAYLQGEKYLWILVIAFIVPTYLYSMKSKRYCTIKEGFFYSLYTTIPLFIISSFLYLLSLLIAPIGLLYIFTLLKYFLIIWVSVFVGFILLNLCFVGLYKLISKTSFYKNWTRTISVLFLYLTHKSPFLWVLIGTIIAGVMGIFSSLIINKNLSIIGTSQLMDRDSFYSRAIVYDKNKLLIVLHNLYEVFDIDKKELIKFGKIDGLKFNEQEPCPFSLQKINDDEVFILNLLEYHHKQTQGSHLFSFGVLNLKDFSFKNLGEYIFEKTLPNKMFTFGNGKILIVGDSTKAYIYDKEKIDTFTTEEWDRPCDGEDVLIPFKEKYLLIHSRAWQHEPKYIHCTPLIQEFDSNNKTLKTLYKQGEEPSYRPLNIILNNNKLIITSLERELEYRLKIEIIDLNTMEKFSEKIIDMPDSEFGIRSIALQNNNLLIFGAITMHRTGYYMYNLNTNTLNKKLFRTNYLPENGDGIINLENGDIINYKNIYSEGKIYLFKNLT